MVQNDIHRSHVLTSLRLGKTKDARWFLRSLLVVVQGCGRKLFFACSGNGNGSSWNNRGSNGNYWASSLNSATNGRNLNFNSGGVNPQNNNNRFNGFAVRAVQHTLLTILFLLLFVMYGTDTPATSVRPLPGILRCETAQGPALVCTEMGSQSQAEYGTAVRRPIYQTLHATAVEMLHCGVSEETGDIRCNVPRQDSTSPLFQLYPSIIRTDIHSGHLQLHQGPWHALRHRSYYGLLPQGESELAAQMLCDAPGYSWLLHAYCSHEATRYCHDDITKDGHTQRQQGQFEYMERQIGYRFHYMANGNHCHVRPKGELYCGWRPFIMGWIRPSKIHASSGRRSWSANRQSDQSAILKCLPECIRPVYETGVEMQILWPLCGRCSSSQCRQAVAPIVSSENQRFSKEGTWTSFTYGETGNFRGASWRGVPGSLHQALQDIHLQSRIETYHEEDKVVRLRQALGSASFGEQLSRNLPTHIIIQDLSQVVRDTRDTTHRHLRRKYDKDNRQKNILQTI